MNIGYFRRSSDTDTELLQIGPEEALDLIMCVLCRGPVVLQVIPTSRDSDDAVRARFVERVHRTLIDLPLNRGASGLQCRAALDTSVRGCPVISASHEHEQWGNEIAVMEGYTGRIECDSGLVAATYGVGCVNEAGAGGDQGGGAAMGPSHDRDFAWDDIGLATEVRKRTQAVKSALTEGKATALAGG